MRTSTRTTTSTTTSTTYGDLDIELSHTPSPIMDYKQKFFKASSNGDLAVVG